MSSPAGNGRNRAGCDVIPVYRDWSQFPCGNFSALLNSKPMEETRPESPICEHLGVRAGSGNSRAISLLGSERPALSERAIGERVMVGEQEGPLQDKPPTGR